MSENVPTKHLISRERLRASTAVMNNRWWRLLGLLILCLASTSLRCLPMLLVFFLALSCIHRLLLRIELQRIFIVPVFNGELTPIPFDCVVD